MTIQAEEYITQTISDEVLNRRGVLVVKKCMLHGPAIHKIREGYD